MVEARHVCNANDIPKRHHTAAILNHKFRIQRVGLSLVDGRIIQSIILYGVVNVHHGTVCELLHADAVRVDQSILSQILSIRYNDV